MTQYKVTYHTQPCMTSAFYKGTITVWATDDEDAAIRAQQEVHRDFREYSISHIVIDRVSRVGGR